MSRPPIKAMESIKNYCEKTQCRRCAFGFKANSIGDTDFVGCKLQETTPCDWEIDDFSGNEILDVILEEEGEDKK